MAAAYLSKLEALLAQIEADSITAWGAFAKVVYGRELLPGDPTNVLTIKVPQVEFARAEGGVKGVMQVYEIDVQGRWPWPAAGENILLTQIERAQDWCAQVITGPRYADCVLPYVRNISFASHLSEQDLEEAYDVMIKLTCGEQASHH
jgi:hypothetical protein